MTPKSRTAQHALCPSSLYRPDAVSELALLMIRLNATAQTIEPLVFLKTLADTFSFSDGGSGQLLESASKEGNGGEQKTMGREVCHVDGGKESGACARA